MLKKCVLKWLCDFYVFQNDKKLSNGFKNFIEGKKLKIWQIFILKYIKPSKFQNNYLKK